MSASEVIEQVKKLSPENRQAVQAYLDRLDKTVNSLKQEIESLTHALKDAPVTPLQPNQVDLNTFEHVKKWALEEHRELLARLAK